jgi:4-hydroxybenzoate polyprenyltransferase
MASVKNYLSLIKFSHTVFAMPFAMIGFFLGAFKLYNTSKEPDHSINQTEWNDFNKLNENEYIIIKFMLVILCMLFARSAAMAFNRYLDRRYDMENPRTAIREIPSGVISARSTLFFTIFCSVAFIACTFFINAICFYLSPIALLIILGYSYTKRFTALCHLILGLGLSLAPIGAYLAVTGEFDIIPILFSFAVIFWVSGFDIIYALQDEEFDKTMKLYSMPASHGKGRALRISKVLHFLSVSAVILAGLLGDFGFLYWIGFVVFTGMLIYQQSIVKPTDLRRVNLAFMTANGIASVVFAIFVIGDMFLNNHIN